MTVRDGPFGENVDPFASRALVVCDHQLAHVYVKDIQDQSQVRALIEAQSGVGRVLAGEERREVGLDHSRPANWSYCRRRRRGFRTPSGSTTAAPDYARTVDIHRKIGYDPCELFFDPTRFWPQGRALRRLIQKKLGFRTLFDVVPLDAGLVRGSHGLPALDPLDRPLLIGDGPPPADSFDTTDVHDLLLHALGFEA